MRTGFTIRAAVELSWCARRSAHVKAPHNFGGIGLEGCFSFEMDTKSLDRAKLVHALAEFCVQRVEALVCSPKAPSAPTCMHACSTLVARADVAPCPSGGPPPLAASSRRALQ